MPAIERVKTRYPGVYAIIGTDPRTGKPEKIFYIVYRKDGKQIEEKAGRAGKDDMTASRASSLRGLRVKGVSPTNQERRETKASERARMTIGKLWEIYETHRDRRKGIAPDRIRYNLHIRPVFGDKIPEEIDPLSLDRFRVSIAKKKSERSGLPLSPVTVHHVMSQLRAIVNFGVTRQLTEGFRAKVPVPPMPTITRTEFLSDPQVAALTKALDEEIDQDTADVVRLALFTGARRAEILKIQWDDVDLSRSVWTLRDRKDGKDSGFPLSSPAQEILARRFAARGDSPFVFPGPGKDGYLKDPREAFERIRAAAILPKNFRILHGLRHHYASSLVSAGVDLYVVSKLLGHSDPSLTARRYAHLKPGAMAQATELAGRLVVAAEKKAKREPSAG
jgi:integrase